MLCMSVLRLCASICTLNSFLSTCLGHPSVPSTHLPGPPTHPFGFQRRSRHLHANMCLQDVHTHLYRRRYHLAPTSIIQTDLMIRWRCRRRRLKIEHSIKVSQAQDRKMTYLEHMCDAQPHGNPSEHYWKRSIDPGVDADVSRQTLVERQPPFYSRQHPST